MIRRLDAIPADSTARYAAQFLVGNYLNSLGNYPEVRGRLLAYEGSPTIQASPSERNVLSALLLSSAQTEDEWMRFALRPTAGWRDPEAVNSERSKPKEDKPYSVLDDDVVASLNSEASIPMLVRLAASPRLDGTLQTSILEAAWTRALLVGRFDLVRQLSGQLAARYNAKDKAESQRLLSKAARIDSNRLPDWQHLLLERLTSDTDRVSGPYLRGTPWAVPTPVGLPLFVEGAYATADNAWGAKWCYPYGAFSPPTGTSARKVQPLAFLSATERHAHQKDLEALRHIPIDTVYFTQSALTLMDHDRRDPLVPQALSVAIRMSRYTCHAKEVGKWSQKGLQALQRDYPNSSWAKTTRYWYDGR